MAQADEDLDLDTENEKKKGGSKIVKILLFTFLGLLIIGLSIGATIFLMKSDAPPADETVAEAEADDEEADEPAAKKKKGKSKKKKKADNGSLPIYIEIKPKFVVNLNDTESTINFLQVSITVVVYTSEEEALVKLHMPVIKHHLVQLFGDQKFNDLRSGEGKKELQQEALDIVQEAMADVSGDETITNLFITSIVGQ